MSGPVPHKLLADAAAKFELPKNKKLSAKAKKRRTAPGSETAWGYPESDYVCELTFYTNSKKACVANIMGGETRLLSATHPASILAIMYLVNAAVDIVTDEGNAHFDPAWNLDCLSHAAMVKKLGYSKCPWLDLATTPEEHEWLDGFWMFSHDNFEHPSDALDQYVRSSQFYLRHLKLDHLIRRPLQTPDPKGWKKTLKQRHNFTYYPDL